MKSGNHHALLKIPILRLQTLYRACLSVDTKKISLVRFHATAPQSVCVLTLE